MEITYRKSYRKSFEKLPLKVKQKAITSIALFFHSPFSPELKNHALNGEYEWCRSINVTGDFRAIFKEHSNGLYEFVEFIEIGTHSQLYK